MTERNAYLASRQVDRHRHKVQRDRRYDGGNKERKQAKRNDQRLAAITPPNQQISPQESERGGNQARQHGDAKAAEQRIHPFRTTEEFDIPFNGQTGRREYHVAAFAKRHDQDNEDRYDQHQTQHTGDDIDDFYSTGHRSEEQTSKLQ